MRELGYLCQVVERYNPFAKVRQDLFGFIDILCVKKDRIVGVQTTTMDHMAERVVKIKSHENYYPVAMSGIQIEVHGWRKLKAGWECSVVNL